jgi:hypothetical protein
MIITFILAHCRIHLRNKTISKVIKASIDAFKNANSLKI